MPPPDLGPLDADGLRASRVRAGVPRPMPKPRQFSADEMRAIDED
jgi:hypothetical protein